MKSIFRFTLFSVSLLILFAALSFTQTGKIDNIAEQAASVTEFEVNGLKVILKRRASAPTFAAGLFFRGGARNLMEKTTGIEAMTLNVATEGGTKYPRQVLRRELSRTGSSIASGSGKDYSAISFASTRQNFDRIWELFSDVVINPAFAPADVERTRQQILAGLREKETDPDGALNSLEDRVIYTGHPYGRDVNGTAETIASFTPRDLRAYHRSLMETSRLLLVVVGDIDAVDLKARVTGTFGKLPRGSYKETPVPPLDFSKATVDIVPRNIPTNYIQGVYNAPSLKEPDYYAMRVATTILQQLVFDEVRNRRQLSYAPNASLDNLAANNGSIYVTAVDANQAVKVMLDQIKFLKTDAISDEAISGMAGQFLTGYYVGQEANTAQVSELARYELIGGGWRKSFEFLNRIREVKPDDIKNVANKYMKNIRFSVIGDQNSVNRAIFLQQ